MVIDFTKTKEIVIKETETVVVNGKEKEKTIATHNFTVGLIDHRTFMNLNIAVARGVEYGDIIYKYLPYFIIRAPGYEGEADIHNDGFFKTRHILLDWAYKNINPKVALPLFEKSMKYQSLSAKEVKNSNGRQGSPSKKQALKQVDAAIVN